MPNKTHKPYLGDSTQAWMRMDNIWVSQPKHYWEHIPSIASITGERDYAYQSTALKAAQRPVMTFDFAYTRVTVVHKQSVTQRWYFVNYIVPRNWWDEELRIQKEMRVNHGVYNGKPNPYSIR